MPYLIAGTCYVCTETRRCRRYVNGWRCSRHAPDVPVPDPERTLAAIRGERLSLAEMLNPLAIEGASDVLKKRPGGYVSRQRAAKIAAGTQERQHR